MPTLLLSFPGRHYHATPWGHHVNEGLVEWPPSPWRLLRSLLATGYAKLNWPVEGPPDIARRLIDKLANVLPNYRLPSAAGAHSRHYMPLARLEKGREKTTLVFDTWAHVRGGELAVRWDIALTVEEFLILEKLAENLGYLGRSESWVEARVVSDEVSLPDGTDSTPCEGVPHRGHGWEQVALLAPMPSSDYDTWLKTALEEALAKLVEVNTTKKKLTRSDQKRIETIKSSYPSNLFACLQVQTEWLQKLGWSQPPGSRRVLYWRRADALEAGAPKPKLRRIEAPPVEAMLLSLATASATNQALPNITRTLPQAELLHRALVAQAARLGRHSVVLSGCEVNRQPLKASHRHAHVLPLDLNKDGRIDHVLIWAPSGLDAHDQAAIRAVRRTFTKGSSTRLGLALAAAGSIRELSHLQEPYGRHLTTVIGSAKVWQSLTPFVPPRYMKKRGRNTLEGQVAAELESRGLPSPSRIRLLDSRDDAVLLRYRHFVHTRRLGPVPPIDCGFILEISFAEAVPGPLTLGYGSHFGLGMFRTIG